MKKQNGILIPLLAIGVVFWLGYGGFGWQNNFKDKEIAGMIETLIVPDSPRREAWQVFENYLAFARSHDLAGVRSLSQQLSPACQDPSKQAECFALMDNVYAIASRFEFAKFRHIKEDERRIIMFTDGPVVTILYFTRDENRALKVQGIKFCLEEENAPTPESCVETI